MTESTAASARTIVAALAAVALTVASLAPTACENAPAESGVVVRDSAGVTLVEHGRVDLDALPAWELSPEPRFSIGTVEGDEASQLHGVFDVRRLRDGSIVLTDRSRQVRKFDASGEHVWSAGGAGEGPGEFQFPALVREVAADSLVVWDGALVRLTVLTAAGEVGRVLRVRDISGQTTAWGMAGPQHLLIEARHAERAVVDGHEALLHPSDFYLVNLEGEVQRELGRRLFATNFQEVDENGAFSSAIFSAPAVVGPAPGTTAPAAATRSEAPGTTAPAAATTAPPGGLWFGTTKEYELRREIGPDRVTRIIRWQGPDRTVRPDDVEAVLEVWGEGLDDPGLRRFFAEYGETHPRADRFAAYEELIVDRSGRLWVRDFVKDHQDDGLRRWTVFSADGTEILGRLTHPASFQPHDVGDGWILGVERDELDVERVRLYDIQSDPDLQQARD